MNQRNANAKLGESRRCKSGQTGLRSEGGASHDDDRRRDRRHYSRLAGFGGDGFRTQRAQPTSGKPRAWNQELGPAAIQANSDVRRRRHRRMAQCTRAVAKQTDFRRHNGDSGRLALRAHHTNTSGDSKPWRASKRKLREEFNVAEFPPSFQQ